MGAPSALRDLLTRTVRLPVVAAPMFLVSRPELVIAQCAAGIIGSFPALNARPQENLDSWLQQIDAGRGATPYAVNQIVHRTNARLDADMDICERHRVPLIITSLGARADINARVQGWGGYVLHDVISPDHARKALDKGVDGLIAVAAGAGGHAGRLSPFALVQEIRRFFDGPLLLSGAIATGGAIAAARAMGADMAYIGSPFIATDEATADPRYKAMIVAGGAGDIVLSDYFSGVPANYLKASVTAAGFDPENLPPGSGAKMDFGARETSKPTAWRDIWSAGHGIGAIDRVQPVAGLVDRLIHEYDAARGRLAQR